jgi:indole-3-glycerol phosphate synthase
MSFLDEVNMRAHKRVQADKQRVSVEQLKQWIKRKPAVKDFRAGIHKPGVVSLIAELKQASPSAGVIRVENNIPVRIAGYGNGGAGALSILTEEEYFNGSPQLLELARKESALPLLRKDFIVDRYQIEESRVLGADAILLIALSLPGGLLYDFIQHALDTQLTPLVEVHDERDLERAINAHAKVIGVNNRDLHTLKVDLATSGKLIPMIPKIGYTIVSESGIRTPEDVRHCGKIGAHAVLVGESLMRQPDAALAVRTLVEAGKDAFSKNG